MKKKIASSNCLGVPRRKGEIVLITDDSDVGGGGTNYQWQELNPAELTHCHYRTSGLNRDGSLKHDYPTSEWRLVPLGHRNWKWNQARSNYSTHDQELLAGMLVLSSQSRLLGSNPIVWLCDQEPVKSFQKGPPPEKAKLKRWWTYLSQFRLTVHHIPGIKNELSDYISRNNFDALIGESSEALAREAFQRMDVQLDLSMRTAPIVEGWSLTDYQSEYKEILQTLSTGLEPRVIDGHQWYKNNQYLFYEDRIVVPEARLDGCLQWSHLSSGHTGANYSVDFCRECFYSSLTLSELRSRMQTIVDACGCHGSKQSDSRDRGLISSLPIPYCANSLLYVDFIHGLPRFGYLQDPASYARPRGPGPSAVSHSPLLRLRLHNLHHHDHRIHHHHHVLIQHSTPPAAGDTSQTGLQIRPHREQPRRRQGPRPGEAHTHDPAEAQDRRQTATQTRRHPTTATRSQAQTKAQTRRHDGSAS